MRQFHGIRRTVMAALCSVVMVCALLSTSSITAQAQVEQINPLIQLVVNNTWILFNRATYGVEATDVVCGSGHAYYDDDNKTLTLDNCTIEVGDNVRDGIYIVGDLTIKLVGTNTIISTGTAAPIMAGASNLYITGDGTLKMKGDTCLNLSDANLILYGSNAQLDLEAETCAIKAFNKETDVFGKVTVEDGAGIKIESNGSGIESDLRVVLSGGSKVDITAATTAISTDSYIDVSGSEIKATGGDNVIKAGKYINATNSTLDATCTDPSKTAIACTTLELDESSSNNLKVKGRIALPSNSSEEEDSTPCNHTYEWETYQQATATSDGIMRYRCTKCGTVEYEVPVTAYYTFNKETQESIQKAAPNATVTVQTPIFISFHEMVKDALAARPDVTLVVDYRNAGKNYEMIIPAGSAEQLGTLFGDSQFAGFLYLGGTYATTELPDDWTFSTVPASVVWFGTTNAH